MAQLRGQREHGCTPHCEKGEPRSMNTYTILITNDDGIGSDGIIRLARTAKQFGEVWVVAPYSQRSAASHSITLHSPLDIYPHSFPVEGIHAYSCTGTPGDCVRVGSLFIMPRRPDVVLSGINYGYNVASDIQYSATAGAAFEASFQGFSGIALSEEAVGCHETTDAYLPVILERLIGRRPEPGRIINVNFPGCPAALCRGILEDRTVSSREVYMDRYLEQKKLANGGVRVMVDGIYHDDAEPGSDYRAVLDRYISVGIVRNVG